MSTINDKPKIIPALTHEPAALQAPASPPSLMPSALTAPLPPPAPVAIFETADPARTRPQPLPEASPAIDVGAAITEHMLPLAEAIERGVKPPSDMRPQAMGTLVDEQPLENGVPFGQILSSFASQLRAENTDASVKEEILDTLIATQMLTPPEGSAPLAKPIPQAVVAQVASALRQSGDVMAAKGDASVPPQAHEGIVIPGPTIVALEAAIKNNIGGFDLASMDVETMAMIVMFEASKGSKQDLREMIGEMDATRKKKDHMRSQIQAAREAKTRTEAQLRAEYNQGRSLDPDDEHFIPASVSFEDYKAQRELDFATDGEGNFDPALGASLTANQPTFPQGTTSGASGPAGTGGAGQTGGGPTPGTSATGWAGIPDDVKAVALSFNLPAEVARAALDGFNALQQSGMLEVMFNGQTPSFEQFLARGAEVSYSVKLGPMLNVTVHGKPGETVRVAGQAITIPLDAPGGIVPGGDAKRNASGVAALLQSVQSTYLNPDWVQQQLTGSPPGSGGMYQNVVLSQLFLNFEDGNVDGVVKLKLETIASDQLAAFNRLKNAATKLFGDAFAGKIAGDQNKIATDWRQSLKTSYADWKSYQRDDIPREWDKVIGANGFSWSAGNSTGTAKYPEYMKAFAPLCRDGGLSVQDMISLFDTDGADRRSGDAALESLCVQTLSEQNDIRRRTPQGSGSIGAVKKTLDQAIAALKSWQPKAQLNAVGLTQATESVASTRMKDIGSGDHLPRYDVGGGGGTPPPKPPKPPKLDAVSTGALAATMDVTPPTTKPPVSPTTPTAEPPTAPQSSESGQRATGMNFASFDSLIEKMQNSMDSISELGESQQLRLQMYMDSAAGIHQTLSNMLKKWSDTSSAIMANLK